MRFLRLWWFFIPAALSFLLAASVIAQTPLSEENRRIIERIDERVGNFTARHEQEVRDMNSRLNNLEEKFDRNTFWILVATGGLGAGVGVDKAAYWYKRRNGRWKSDQSRS